MKDQRKLLNDCIKNDVPAVVFQGTDSCAVEILKAALEIYRKKGCSEEFIFDLELLIKEIIAFQSENPEQVKLAKIDAAQIAIIKDIIKSIDL